MIELLEPLDIMVYMVMHLCLYKLSSEDTPGLEILEHLGVMGSWRQKSCCIYSYLWLRSDLGKGR